MAIIRYGRYVTSPEADLGIIGAGAQRACVYDNLGSTLIVYQLGGWLGKDSGTPVARLGIGAVTGSTPDPGARIAYTDEFSPTANYVDISGGASYERTVTPFVADPGRYALVLVGRSGVVAHSMRQASAITALNKNFYNKSGLGSTVPTNPIGGTPAINGHMSLWVVGMVNEKPAVPNFRTPTGTLTDGDTTPNLVANFSDPNQTLPNGVAFDTLTQVGIEVRQVGQTALKWQTTYVATSSEKTANQSSIEYAGTALSFGVNYEWRIRHSDKAGAWSDWSTWLSFSLAPAGAVDLPTSPVAKINANTTSFVAKWTSQAALSTNAVQIQLYVGTSLVKESPIITKTVANNANISITWAETTFATLAWGTPYRFRIRGRDTGNVWSDYSSYQTFNTDAAPTVPSNLTPPSNTVVTTYPLLEAQVSDADGDSVTVKFRIKNSAGTVLFTRTGVRVGTTTKYRYQVVAADFASFATYRWDSYSFDGFLYSGATTVEANASKPNDKTVVYADGPTVTITSPTNGQVFAGRTIPMAWTTTNQTQRQIFFYDDTGTQIYSSADAVTGALSVPVTNAMIYNGKTYTAVVKVTNNLGLTGYSDPVPFSLSYAPATAIQGFSVFPVTLGSDALPTANMLTWQATTYPASAFVKYDIYSTDLNGQNNQPLGLRQLVGSISNPLQTAFLDALVPSGVTRQYELEQSVIAGIEVITSVAALASSIVNFDGVILGSVWEPETYHVDLRYASTPGDEGDWEYGQDVSFYLPTGGSKSQAITGLRQEWNPSGSYKLLSDTFATAKQRRDRLVALIQRGGTMCIRDGHGESRFVQISGARIRNLRAHYEADLAFQEVSFVPGSVTV